MAKKIEIIDLDLGFDPQSLTTKPPLSEKTAERLDQLIKHEQKEQKAIQNYKEQKQQTEQKREEALENCLKKLIELTEQKELLSIEDLLKICESDEPVGTMIRLRNLIKKRGNLWDIKKRRVDNKTKYQLVPTISKS